MHKGEAYLGDLGVDGRIMIKLISKKVSDCGLDSSDSEQDPVAGC
jgi:hypothetical protein